MVNCYGTTEIANWIAVASSHDDGIAEGLIETMTQLGIVSIVREKIKP
jgi:hypothetical protein